MTTFADLGVPSGALAALARQGITDPLPVQEAALSPLLAGRDAVIQAPTGSGKTLAFALPAVGHLGGHARGGPRALVVVPTRELAAQIAAVVASIDRRLRLAVLIGGAGYGVQLAALRSEPDVVIGCPGRILDLAQRGAVSFGAVRLLVLDEADEMLDQGFARDVERIIALTPPGGGPRGRQTVLASATMPGWVQRMIDRHLVDPVRVERADAAEPALEHGLVRVRREERVDLLSRLLRGSAGSAIVFCRTKHGAKKLARDLTRLGHSTGELQGNLSQNARDRAIADFRALRTEVLVATNVAARGLDIAHVQLVVNHELPESAQWLTHRIGRTARNGAEGRALTFLGDEDDEQWRKLRRGGAPALPWVDVDVLLATGTMTPADPPAARVAPATETSASPPSSSDRRSLGRTGVRRRPRVGPAPAASIRTLTRGTVTRSGPGAGHRPCFVPSSRANCASSVNLREGRRHRMSTNGTVKKVQSDRGFGFIAADDGQEYFFHRSGLDASLDFDRLIGGEHVTFDVQKSEKGPRAARVRAAE